jgi:hypothetical protein
MTNDSDDLILERLHRLRAMGADAEAPDRLWNAVRADIDRIPPSVRGGWRHGVAIAAGVLLLAGVFAAGRLSAKAGSPDSRARLEQPATLAVQESSTQFVQALDALSAVDSVKAPVRDDSREVALVALGAVIAVGSAEYPLEMEQLFAATRQSLERAHGGLR